MCYAIPGVVVEIRDKLVTIDYFGERKLARNDFCKLAIGDYVLAQGGFIIERVEETKAKAVLSDWKELFNELQETDMRLTSEAKTLYQLANKTRHEHTGNSCCVHGIINFSNYCVKDCLYCGIRNSNDNLIRYRMSVDEIVEASDMAVNKYNFKALVLQSGEDMWYNDEILMDIIDKVRSRCNVLLIMSIGERDLSTYKLLYERGARGILLRFETSKEDLYSSLKPGSNLKKRIELIEELHRMGYLIMTGFLVGLPGQTEEDILRDIHLTNKLHSEMFSFGPFISHKDTPLKDASLPSLDMALTSIARARMLYPDARILVTTALETLDKFEGAKKGLLAGGNSLMIDMTPVKYQKLYSIYPEKKGTESSIEERIEEVTKLLESIGRAPTDLGL